MKTPLRNPRPAAGRRSPLTTQAGMTLIEMMIVLAIVLLLVVAAVFSFVMVKRERLRKAVNRVAGSVRYAYDRARATGKDHRLVFDLGEDSTRYWLEVTEKGQLLAAATAEDARKDMDDEQEGAKKDDDDDTTAGGLSKAVAAKRAPKPAWKPYKSKLSKEVTLKQYRVTSIYVARLDEEVTEGKVALYFWGNGQTERAIVYVQDKEGKNTFSLVTHPLTGKVKVYPKRYEFDRGEATQDDEGEEVKER
jgi:prepilin-type N-terminal cleavage/methylation domain-containing protein